MSWAHMKPLVQGVKASECILAHLPRAPWTLHRLSQQGMGRPQTGELLLECLSSDTAASSQDPPSLPSSLPKLCNKGEALCRRTLWFGWGPRGAVQPGARGGRGVLVISGARSERPRSSHSLEDGCPAWEHVPLVVWGTPNKEAEWRPFSPHLAQLFISGPD